MIRNIHDGLRSVLGRLYIDRGNVSDAVFLAGTGRSGTTWLADVINFDNSFRFMFEPFHSREVAILSEWNYRQYLRPEISDEKFAKPAETILSGRIRNPWVDRYNKRPLAHKRLIKDIRANLILKWINTNFPDIPIVLTLRHPCAVANSKIKLSWNTHLEDFIQQNDLVLDFLYELRNEIQGATEIFDKHIFMWCIENYVPLKQFKGGEIHVVFYESLCVNPHEELNRLFAFIGKEMTAEVYRKLGKASVMSRRDSPILSGGNLTSSWRKGIGDKQIGRALEILALFGLDKIYGSGDLPLLSGKDVLRAFS